MREPLRLVLGPHEAPSAPGARIGIAALLIALTLCVLLVRLWQLQIEEGGSLRALSENNRLRLKRTPPLRGVIYDRNGQVLVDNRPSYNVVVVPEDTPDVQTTLAALSSYVTENTTFADGVLPRDPRRPAYEGVVIAKDVAWSTLVAVESHQMDIPGVSVEVSTKRHYPPDGLAAHLLGYVGEVNPQEMALFPTYRLGDLIGKFGIERQWETDLRGHGGGQEIEVDAMGRRLRVLGELEASAGQSLVLTIDRALQEKTEAVLAGREGAIVVLAVHSGEVLAMVSRPTFDQKMFAAGIMPE
jgi:penicillin-binding protein 2